MNKYLLTYFYGGQFVSTIVDAQGIAATMGKCSVPGARNFRAYKITPDNVIPMRLSGTINSMTVSLYDDNGGLVESVSFRNA